MPDYLTGQFGTEQSQFGWVFFGSEGFPPIDYDANTVAAGWQAKTATIEAGAIERLANLIAADWTVYTASPGFLLSANANLGGWSAFPASLLKGVSERTAGQAQGNWQAKTAEISPTELFPGTINAVWAARTAELAKLILEPNRIPFVGNTYEVLTATLTSTEITANTIPALWGTPQDGGASVNPTGAEAGVVAGGWGTTNPQGASMDSYVLEAQVIAGGWQAKTAEIPPVELFPTRVPGAWAPLPAELISSIIDAHVVFGDWKVKTAAREANIDLTAGTVPGTWGIFSATLEAGMAEIDANVNPANYQNPSAEGSNFECWEPLSKRMLNYLAAPFQKGTNSRMGRFFAGIARELSGCTADVVRLGDTDVRGNGTLTITTRFEPITAVSTVERIDENGVVLETYTVASFSGRKIILSGGTPPKSGDRLRVTYTYQHQGLEHRVRLAMRELNILTATGEFLDNWGRLFGVPRLTTGKYGSFKYGAQKYGTSGTESDSQYARRIIDRVLQVRNTKPSILAAVQRVTGGSPYMVEWFETGVHRGWVWKRAEDGYWMGDNEGTATRYHLIWGETARFLNDDVSGGGGCVAEVWVPPTATASLAQIVEVANAYKAAGIKIIVRQFTVKKHFTITDTGTGTDTVTRVIIP